MSGCEAVSVGLWVAGVAVAYAYLDEAGIAEGRQLRALSAAIGWPLTMALQIVGAAAAGAAVTWWQR